MAKRKKYVWALMDEMPYEGGTLVGVFSTPMFAKAAIEESPHYKNQKIKWVGNDTESFWNVGRGETYVITRMEIDADD